MDNDVELAAGFAEHGITVVSDGEYLVRSSDGQRSYTVRFEGSPEWMNPLVNTYSCTCPAGTYGKTCKHIDQVAAANADACEALGCE